jgi:DegV family protein with EDD domain
MPIKNVAIIAESTCCLPEQMVEKYRIRIMPLVINFAGKSYQDGVDITPSEVYQIMRKKEELPTTSTLSPGDFLQAIKDASGYADSALCITLTSLQSKTHEAALLAKELAQEKIAGIKVEVFDSRSVSGALGMIVLEAARAADSGLPLSGVLARAREIREKVNFLAMVDTLYYLARTGRIGYATHWFGSVLQLKPILEHSPAVGITMPFARPRTRTRAVEKMLQTMHERMGTKPVHVMVHHADEVEECQRLKERIDNEFDCREIYMTEFSPIMGVHAGPGVLAVAFYAD